jgi:carbamoyltransferase
MSKIAMGLSTGHNRGAAITVDGEIKVAISNERITRIKTDHSEELPVESMQYCIDALGISYDDIDIFVYNITEPVNTATRDFELVTGQPLSKLKFIPHHIAHAYSTFAASGYEEAAVVVVDAMGSVYNDTTPIKDWYQLDESELEEGQEWAEGYSIYQFKKGSINPEPKYKKWVRFPFQEPYEGSVGYFYGMGARQLVYNPKSNTWPAGKLMGLASYANPKMVDSFSDFSIRTENDLQVPASPILEEDVNWETDFQAKADIAGLYQREQELNSMHLVEMAKRLTDSDNICVAGGSFLNCNTNEMIIRSGLFENQYFMPPADDSGIPHGCAYAGAAYLMDEIRTGGWMSAYTGKIYSDEDIEKAAKTFDVVNVKKVTKEIKYNLASEMLNDNKVIGWMQNGSESGPRALGNRSMLASPKSPWMVNYINSEIKKREWYRPFAPSVLYEKQGEIFDLDTYSPYMLVTTTVKEEWRNKIPSVVHHDGTSRYQSVTPENNEEYYNLISAFHEKSGVPVVLNTSFNGPEEPVVETPEDAINSMLKHDLFALFINDYLIIRNDK